MARMLYPDNTNWTEPDLAFALDHRMHEVWETTEAIKVIIDAACDEAIGEVVDLIRQAEGVDTVAVDAALGVEPEDDGFDEPGSRFDSSGQELPPDDAMGTD